jgi:predicted CDP-diglyceride synthetase/phosphatidate cytidylyltransferase
MGIGGTIVLIAVGAILTFATDWQLAGINLDLAGLIMMAVGFIGLAAYVSILKRRRVQPPAPGAPVIEVEDHNRYYR